MTLGMNILEGKEGYTIVRHDHEPAISPRYCII